MSTGRRYALLVLSAALSLCVLRGLLAAEMPAPPPPPAPGAADAVMVESVGLASMPAGRPLSEVHREALLDARRNAVIQAHVIVEARDRVQGMRLQESLVRSEALGYVERMEVWESGPVADADPPTYRVRVRALVRPLSTFSATAAFAQSRRDPWQPVLTLSIDGDAAGRNGDQIRATLTDALHRCGIGVQARAGAPTMVLRMTLTAPPPGGDRSVVADWELSAGADGTVEGRVAPAGIFVGHWQIAAGDEGLDSWRRIALMIAQDSLRLWATPRWTTVRFLKPSAAQSAALAGSFGHAADARVTAGDEPAELVVGLPITGDPVAAVDAFVAQAGLAGEVEPGESSLTELTYTCRPAARRVAQTPDM